MTEKNADTLKKVLKSIKLQESTISMLFGIASILVIGVIAIRYVTTTQKEVVVPPVAIEDVNALPSTHVVTDGESLWSIAEKYYGTGYNWVDIKEANNIDNPDSIADGQELAIPQVTPRNLALETNENEPELTQTEVEPTPTESPFTDLSIVSKAESSDIENISQEEYVISEGDSLWKLAERYYSDGNRWVDIAEANNIENPSLLTSNQKLMIPAVLAAENSSSTGSENKDISESTTYIVQSGDSLWSIAQEVYGDGDRWIEIAENNNLLKPSIIHAGNILTLTR